MRLRLYLTAQWQDASSPCFWVILDDAGNVHDSGYGTLASLPQASSGEVILAADRVLSLSVSLPPIRRRQLESALPYLIEDSLLEDPSGVHVVPGVRLVDGQTVLYVVSKAWFSRFLSAARTAMLRIDRAVPEFCLLPVRDNEWSLGCTKSYCFLAMPGYRGSILDGEELRRSAALQLRLEQTRPAALRIFLLDDTGPPTNWNPGLPIIIEKQSFDWRRAFIPSDAPSLLWGPFAPPARIEALWYWLRPALMAGVVALGVEIAFTHLEWALFAWEKQRMSNQMVNIFHETFGADAAIVDPYLQMRRHIARLRHAAGLRDDADFLPILEKFSSAMSVISGYKLRTLQYETGHLMVEMNIPNAATLDSLRQHLARSGLTTVVTSKQENGDTLSIHLRISS